MQLLKMTQPSYLTTKMFAHRVHLASGQILMVHQKELHAELVKLILSVLTKAEIRRVRHVRRIQPQQRKDKRFAASVRPENT